MRDRQVRLWIGLLAAAAAVNLAAGLVLAWRQPDRASDLLAMYDWCRSWLVVGRSLYTGPDASTDYPPNAIPILAPLGVLPSAVVVPVWTFLGLALAVLVPWLLADATSRERGVPFFLVVVLFCGWNSARTLLQFSMLSLALAFAAVRGRESRWSGVALGLALFKPHIAGPVALWAMATGRWRMLVNAALVVAAAWLAYDLRIGERPDITLAGYWHVLTMIYGGEEGMLGQTSIRRWVVAAIADARLADAVWLAASGALLLLACWRAMQTKRNHGALDEVAIVGLFSLWSLLTVYHNYNNLVLMLPAFIVLLARAWSGAGRLRWLPVGLVQLALMFDVPARLDRFAPPAGWIRVLVDDGDRLLVLATFAFLVVYPHDRSHA